MPLCVDLLTPALYTLTSRFCTLTVHVFTPKVRNPIAGIPNSVVATPRNSGKLARGGAMSLQLLVASRRVFFIGTSPQTEISCCFVFSTKFSNGFLRGVQRTPAAKFYKSFYILGIPMQMIINTPMVFYTISNTYRVVFKILPMYFQIKCSNIKDLVLKYFRKGG